ncbi:Lipase domain protein, putative [Chondrus crispus]|uniref:Lipase domain protein, putative n=1 Tax=Chondrus crispus TaxID=2769 RepID=R7QCH7_CHOCR|nr:Lipase domain protein, putative [Chondrus crispus]CDF36212.1 Lipase domain protein, putative [Chondrus crispus]|eukprot:XP_005716031.1 Lipase domain protein, putative [Chondrus crispus]
MSEGPKVDVHSTSKDTSAYQDAEQKSSPRFEGGNLDAFKSDERFSEHVSSDEDDIMNLTLNTDAAENLSLALARRQFTKLEVVQARQIESILRWHHAFVGVGVLFTLLLVVLMNTAFLDVWITPKDQGWKFDIRQYDPPDAIVWINQVAAIPLFVYALALCIIFTTRIMGMIPTSRTKEQIWVIFLLFSIVIYMNPFPAIKKIHDVLLHRNEVWLQWGQKQWCQNLLVVSNVMRVSGFTATTVFYIWASIHSYGILESKIDWRFYVPKVVVLLIYIASKIVVTFEYKIYPAELFFATFVGMVSVYSAANTWPLPGVVYATLTFVFEIILSAFICREYQKTKKVLKNADYLQYRTKQIGFRFFMYHNITFYAVFSVLYIILLAGLPNGINVFALTLRGLRYSYFDVHDMVLGIQLLLLAYATVEAYVNLPADALGLKGWFVPQMPKGVGAEKSELEPITYRKREPPSLHGVVSDLSVNCFVMQTHVTLFNFAWLVYYWDTPKVDNFKLTQDVFKFTVADYIKDKVSDTHVLVVDGADRIVIAFKGTTSSKNLKTDVNLVYSNARALLPTQIGEEDPEGDAAAKENPILKTRDWRRAKIHKGFAVAYSAVGPRLLSIIKKLQDEKRRPVFLTGHSLGGALATVCSMDLFLRLGMTRKEIFVSTFGAPRVGNRQFWNVYNENVPIHWRIVVGPDVVAKLPKVGYIHVGKKVLITVDGDLFIDPNSLELNMWSGDVASILYHRKASYLLAMRAWCERHHGDEYLPEFWPFPVSKDDTRRFQHAMMRSTTKTGLMMSTRPTANKRARILHLDAMINALGGPDVDAAVADLWKRLARGLMERESALNHV